MANYNFFRIALSKNPLSFLNAKFHPHNHILRFYKIIFYVKKVNDIFYCRNKTGSELRGLHLTLAWCNNNSEGNEMGVQL